MAELIRETKGYISAMGYTKEDIQEMLEYALEGRRRVKEQLKKIGGMEYILLIKRRVP